MASVPTVRYAVGRTLLGPTLVAVTGKGVCAVKFPGASGLPGLLAQLKKRFPEAELAADPEGLQGWFEKLDAVVAGRQSGADVPLDLRGTPFELKVWRALRKIPCGQTWSYGELARRIGAPQAVRAAAGACGRNPVAILVPCHRVIQRNGGLGGFTGGLNKKRVLLDHEGVFPTETQKAQRRKS